MIAYYIDECGWMRIQGEEWNFTGEIKYVTLIGLETMVLFEVEPILPLWKRSLIVWFPSIKKFMVDLRWKDSVDIRLSTKN